MAWRKGGSNLVQIQRLGKSRAPAKNTRPGKWPPGRVVPNLVPCSAFVTPAVLFMTRPGDLSWGVCGALSGYVVVSGLALALLGLDLDLVLVLVGPLVSASIL